MLADKEGEKMEKLIEIIAAMEEEEKKAAIKLFDSDILFEELWLRSIEERKAIADIEETLNNRKQGLQMRETNAIR